MKKSSKIIILLVLLLIGFNSCERDDLCDSSQAVTPRLIVTFVNANNTLERKAVASLTVREIVNDTLAPLNDTGATALAAVDSIAIPLNTNDNLTTYRFSNDDGTIDLMDDIAFSYVVNEEYINRACGFKNTFEDLTATLANGSNSWIDNVEVITDNVTNTNNIHVEIRH